MPVRSFSRDGQWLFPPRVEELIGERHPARFVAAFVDQLDHDAWLKIGVQPGGDRDGAPAYHPALLLSVWLYGFMTKVRSTRNLEAACRDQLPFIWLSANQRPDHNTLWRFYNKHRKDMRRLLRLTVQTAFSAGLVDLALQAVDGTKLAGNASPSKNQKLEVVQLLLEQTEAAIADLEAQNQTGGDGPAGELPPELGDAIALRDKVKGALQTLDQEQGHRSYINSTDPDAALLRTNGGYVTGYNAQAMASPLLSSEGAESTGHFITAVDVANDLDVYHLLSMIEAAEENTGVSDTVTLADAGYHSGPNVAACQEEGHSVVMPESQARALANPYHKDAFDYDPESDTYTCPKGQTLKYSSTKNDRGTPRRWYIAASPAACRACPAFELCTRNKRHGRTLQVGPDEDALQRHRQWMQAQEARALYKQRKQLIEPVFGIIKEQLMGIRRFLLRGLENVRAEWTLLATAFNLRVLARIWASGRAVLPPSPRTHPRARQVPMVPSVPIQAQQRRLWAKYARLIARYPRMLPRPLAA